MVCSAPTVNRVCAVCSSPFYGMSQAGRRWQRSLFPWIEGWRKGTPARSHADGCVFHCTKTVQTPTGPCEENLIIGCYVDDLLITYSHDDKHSLYAAFTRDLAARWDVDDEGDVTDLLGIDISIEENCVCLKQTNYYLRSL